MATPSSSVQNGRSKDENAAPVCTNKENSGWRRIVRNFTPSWFAVTMGTGIVSILLHQFPFSAQWSVSISYGFFGLNVLLFAIFTLITLVRYVLYPDIWFVMIIHPAQSLFLGCYPMGLSTIINMLIFACQSWGDWVVYFAWGLWWLDVALSIMTCVTMPFIVIHRHKPDLGSITATLLLPIVPTVVAAATGGIIAEAMPNHEYAMVTLIISYILWGAGISFSSIILGLYFHRLTIHSLPPKEAIVSVFLPIGPLGQGGFAIQQLGRVALKLSREKKLFASLDEGSTVGGETLYAVGEFLALIMFAFGIVWLAFALISIATMQKFPFNMGWWGFTFPLGTYASSTGMLAKELDSSFFRVLTTVFSGLVCLLWLLVACKTVLLARTGAIFHAPCLKDLRPKEQQPEDAGKVT